MGGRAWSHQDRPDRKCVVHFLEQRHGKVRRVQIGEDQQVGFATQHAVGNIAVAQFLVHSQVTLHLALDDHAGSHSLELVIGFAHLEGAVAVTRTKVRIAQQSHLGLDIEPLEMVARLQRNADDFVGGRIEVHIGVGEEECAPRHDQQRKRRHVGDPVLQPDDRANVTHMLDETSLQAADQRIRLAALDGQRPDHRRIGAHHLAGRIRCHSVAADQRMEQAHIVAITRIVLGIDDLEVNARAQVQPEPLDTRFDDGGAPDQDRVRNPLLQYHLGGPQHAFVFAVGKGNALVLPLRPVDDRLHHEARTEHEAIEAVAISVPVLDRLLGNTRFHRCPRHGGRDAQDQALVERVGDDVLGAEHGRRTGGRNFEARLMGQLGNGAHRRQLHFLVDRGRAHVERTPEDERETQDVVDLVGIVRPPGADHGVGTRGLGQFRRDFWIGVGQRQDQRLWRHLEQHFRLECARPGEPEEYIRALDHLGKRGRVALAAILPAPTVVDVIALVGDQAILVGHPDVLVLGAQRHQHVEAGNGRGPCPGGTDLDVLNLLALELQPVQYGGTDDDGRAMLVVMENRDRHARTQALFDLEAIRCADILEIDPAKGRPERRDGIDELLRVQLVDLEIEHIDTREFLEQDGLAFHHRLAGQGADIAQAQHSRAVGNDGHQVLT